MHGLSFNSLYSSSSCMVVGSAGAAGGLVFHSAADAPVTELTITVIDPSILSKLRYFIFNPFFDDNAQEGPFCSPLSYQKLAIFAKFRSRHIYPFTFIVLTRC